jgi:ubiquinone/menaquinone biosynthesis C-methylase UbiE
MQGVGTGRNIPFYPAGAGIVGVDSSAAMLARAERRARQAAAEIKLGKMDVTQLAFPDRYFDAAVASFLFCVPPEDQQRPALKELGRVVKPGGPIRLLEYVRPRGAIRRIIARLWEPWMRWAYGASFDRRTEENLPEAGLDLVESRFVTDDLLKLITARVPA